VSRIPLLVVYQFLQRTLYSYFLLPCGIFSSSAPTPKAPLLKRYSVKAGAKIETLFISPKLFQKIFHLFFIIHTYQN